LGCSSKPFNSVAYGLPVSYRKTYKEEVFKMSASMGKGDRNTERKVKPASKESGKAKKSGKLSDRFYNIIAIVIAVVLVVSIGVAIFQNVVSSGKFFVAATVGNEKIYPHELNYYYIGAYMNFVNSYGDYLYLFGLDTSMPLKAQKYSEDKTWHRYFLDTALNSLHEVKSLYREAVAAGETLSEEYSRQMESDMASLEQSLSKQNLTLENYLSTSYGSRMTVAEYKRIMSESYLAQQFAQKKYEGYEYSDEDIKNYYQENKNSFDLVDYRSFFFSSSTGSSNPTQEEKDNARTNAKSQAEIMQLAVTDEESFIKLSLQNAPEDQKELYEDDDYTLREGLTYSSITNKDMADWLFDENRTKGDTTIIETDTGYYVVYMVARYRNDYNTVNVRHILVQFDLDENATEPTEEQKEAAKLSAEAIMKEWASGEKTEESFAALAKERSDDPGSKDNGGLYENVYKGMMVEPFEKWCFDEKRQPGDTGLVETAYGYHVMYFSSYGKPYWTIQVENELRNNDYNEFSEGIKEKYPLSENSIGMLAVGLPNQ